MPCNEWQADDPGTHSYMNGSVLSKGLKVYKGILTASGTLRHTHNNTIIGKYRKNIRPVLTVIKEAPFLEFRYNKSLERIGIF